MKSYPHMCRDGHVEIGHADSEHEMCPLCLANSRIAFLQAHNDATVDDSELLKLSAELATVKSKLASTQDMLRASIAALPDMTTVGMHELPDLIRMVAKENERLTSIVNSKDINKTPPK